MYNARWLLLEEVSPWPLDQNDPQAYRNHGISMDHVGKITGDGAFKYKIKFGLNKCLHGCMPETPSMLLLISNVRLSDDIKKLIFPLYVHQGHVINPWRNKEKRIHGQGMVEPSYGNYLFKFPTATCRGVEPGEPTIGRVISCQE